MRGSRCFILGSGHSIDSVDLIRLKNENIIGLNSFSFHKDYKELVNSDHGLKQHVDTPLHEFRNKKVYESYIDEVDNNNFSNVHYFFGIDDYQNNYIDAFKQRGTHNKPNKNYIHCNIPFSKQIELTNDSYNCSKTIWSPKSSSNFALFLALYQGFDEIYLLGVDHDHMNADPENVKAIKEGILTKEETNKLKVLRKDNKKEKQTLHFLDLIDVIKPMEMIEDLFPKRVKNLSTRSIFYCHEVIDLDSIGL
tara:strand:- start:1302 stop:2054 length:753 start_codon:yes stop_codon:yes gene_type:complete